MLSLRTPLYSCLVLSILLSTASWGQQPTQSTVLNENGSIDFQVLDSATGYAVSSAMVNWDTVGQSHISALANSGISSLSGRFVEQLSPGEYAFEISAPGYRPMRTHFGLASGSVVRANINLDPVSPPQELRKDRVTSELHDGVELVLGYIVDALTHRPIANVEVTLLESGATAKTDSRGYFQLYADAVSTADASSPEDFPGPDTLTAKASGYKTYILTGLLYVPGSYSVTRIEMAPGAGVTSEQIDHRPLMSPSSLPDLPGAPFKPAFGLSGTRKSSSRGASPDRGTPVTRLLFNPAF